MQGTVDFEAKWCQNSSEGTLITHCDLNNLPISFHVKRLFVKRTAVKHMTVQKTYGRNTCGREMYGRETYGREMYGRKTYGCETDKRMTMEWIKGLNITVNWSAVNFNVNQNESDYQRDWG